MNLVNKLILAGVLTFGCSIENAPFQYRIDRDTGNWKFQSQKRNGNHFTDIYTYDSRKTEVSVYRFDSEQEARAFFGEEGYEINRDNKFIMYLCGTSVVSFETTEGAISQDVIDAYVSNN